MVHLDGFNFSGNTWDKMSDCNSIVGRSGQLTCRSECNHHAGLNDPSLDTSNGNRANTSNLVDILERKTERFIGRTCRRVDGINRFQKSFAGNLGLDLLLPSLIPWAVLGDVDHVVAIETRDRDERHMLGVVSNLLDEIGCLFDNLVVSVFCPLGSVHLVDGDDDLPHTQGVCKQSVLAGLTIFGYASFEFTSTGSDDENSAVGLRGTSDHVLNEIAVTRRI